MKLDRKTDRALRVARRYADGGDVDQRSTLRRALDTGMDYAGRGLALADLYSGGMLSSAAGLVPGNSIANAQAARDRALEGVPREAKALAVEPVTPYAAIFAGPMARTANRKMLQRAEELASQNAPREQIWNETGWFKGVDGKWRFEIGDSGAKLRGRWPERPMSSGNTTADISGKFDEGIHHEQLLAAYPELGRERFRGSYEYGPSSLMRTDPDGNVAYGPGGGSYSLDGIRSDGFGRNRKEAKNGALSSALHEAMHYVQGIERFLPGGSPEQFRAAPEAFDRYRRLAGEVEARAVQKRMGYGQKDRRTRAPWLDYDVPESEQISKP